MAKARMIHVKISVSEQVNRLSVDAQLLFTWLIPHADDDGRLKGNPEHIKACVVPMKKWNTKKIIQLLMEMHDSGLIYYFQVREDWFIEFPSWKSHQSIKSDRYRESKLPSFSDNYGAGTDTDVLSPGGTVETQSKGIELNLVQEKASTIASTKGLDLLTNTMKKLNLKR